MISPVMALERSLARNRAAPPTSSWSTLRCSGARSAWDLQHVAEVADAAGGEGLDGAGGDGVDADVFGAEVPGEIADRGFEAGLGHGHHVVVGDNFFSGVVAEGHDAAALGHERGGGAADGDERIDADVEGDAEAFAAGVDELAAQLGGGRVGDGVDQDFELAVLLLEGGEEGVDLGCRWRRRTGSPMRRAARR